jgi:fructoselysine-6-P-deglycase FrlB-like protein/sugar/nucleoside kinase (ribokinase family)
MQLEAMGQHERPTSLKSLPRVIVVGNLTIDDVVLPDGTTKMASVGGNSLYTALGVRLWQPHVGIVTRCGEDFPHDLPAMLHALGIAAEGVVNIPGPTVRNWVVYENNGQRSWIYRTPSERSREVAVQEQDIPETWLEVEPAPVVHVTAMPIDAAEAVIDKVRRVSPQARITLDTHEDYVVAYRSRLRALASKVYAFLPSRAELSDLVGYDEPLRALVDLSSLPTPVIVVKMGADGVLVWDKASGSLHEVGIASGQVVDETGAGDAFCGGFAAGLSLGFNAVEAAQRGTISASYAVAGFSSMYLTEVDPAVVQVRIKTDAPIVRELSLPEELVKVEIPGADRGISSGADIMRQEIAMIPRLLLEQQEMLAQPLSVLARRLCDANIEHVYLVGCGDSAFAGAATALAFQKHAGVQAEGVHALEMARYRVRYLPQNSVVVCISFSGKVGRTIEAAKQARRFGHRALVLTGNPDSPLAQEATDIMQLSVPTLGYSPGTSTYLAIVSALFQLAVIWGQLRGVDVTQAQKLLRDVAELAEQTLEAGNEVAQKVAEHVAKNDWITFLGAGPNLATARFGAAKLFEGPGKLGVATNIEEWAHEEYFVSGKETPVFLIAPNGASFDRATEILSELNFIGAYPVFISDTKPQNMKGVFIPLAAGLPEEFSPLLAALPLSQFAYYFTVASGHERFEFPSPEVAKEHYETIHRATEGEPA